MLGEPLPHRSFTVAEVMRMVEAGVLGEDEPVELIEGELVTVPPQGPPHSNRIAELNMFLVPKYLGRAHVRVQLPLYVDTRSMPEPDILIARPTPGRHPGGADSLLAIEIARTSQAFDRAKARLYATAGVPVYWLVDLAERRIEERTEPTPSGDYRLTKLYLPTDAIALPELGETVLVRELLGD